VLDPACRLALPAPVGVGGRLIDDEQLAEIGQELANASRDGLEAFDLASPSPPAGLVGECALGGATAPQQKGVPGCVDELRKGQEQVALTRASAGSCRQWPSSSSVRKKLSLSHSTVSGVRSRLRTAEADGQPIVASGRERSGSRRERRGR